MISAIARICLSASAERTEELVSKLTTRPDTDPSICRATGAVIEVFSRPRVVIVIGVAGPTGICAVHEAVVVVQTVVPRTFTTYPVALSVVPHEKIVSVND